ncbi:MAG: FAD-dependent oxidoreductase [Rhodospirillales bacterium]
MGISVAIVGAGPAGFYCAEALLERCGSACIDIIERLPTPYGLVRAGVAPDHQSTKQVTRKFEQTVLENLVHFYGNVEVGRDVTLDELLRLYDAVVLATGSPHDRLLAIPGEQLPGVYGSSAFVGWYNGHPDFRNLKPRLGRNAVVVGNGNVALDVARILVRSRAEMIASDIPDYALAAIEAADVTDVWLLGRRGPRDTKFAPAELREAGGLAEAVALVDPADLAQQPESAATATDPGPRGRRGEDKLMALFREFARRSGADARRRLHFRFFTAPLAIVGSGRVEGVRVERTRVEGDRAVGTGHEETIAADLVVSAVGYRASPIPGVPFDVDRGRITNDGGRIAPGLYAVGWAKRGPTGVIGSNKPDGVECASQILADVEASTKAGRPALERTLHQCNVRFVTFADWRRIDEAEVASAEGPAPRRKLTSLAEMLAVVGEVEARRMSGHR